MRQRLKTTKKPLKNGYGKMATSIDKTKKINDTQLKKTQFDIETLLTAGVISDELNYERAMIADRQLRLLAKEDAHYKAKRKALRSLIEKYERKHWSDEQALDESKLVISGNAVKHAEVERVFIQKRKEEIRKKLKSLQLTQNDLGILLGHKSKTHLSELMNGLSTFTLRDLVIIHRLLDIPLNKLIPVSLSYADQTRINANVIQLKKSNLKLKKQGLVRI
jgi:transcriptional regulator with XRE-family HTH domain